MIEFATLTPGPDGLVVTVVQDDMTGDVLMVGYMNAEALATTYETGFVHFWSRSRETLWQKGETSGNVLEFRSIATDCDRDSLLVRAVPAGPTCHTGTPTCFGEGMSASLGIVIDALCDIIETRAVADPAVSYTARLLSDPDFAARKVLEEAGEVAFAAKDVRHGAPAVRVVEEAADTIYHLLALTRSVGVDPSAVATELERRMG